MEKKRLFRLQGRDPSLERMLRSSRVDTVGVDLHFVEQVLVRVHRGAGHVVEGDGLVGHAVANLTIGCFRFHFVGSTHLALRFAGRGTEVTRVKLLQAARKESVFSGGVLGRRRNGDVNVQHALGCVQSKGEDTDGIKSIISQ